MEVLRLIYTRGTRAMQGEARARQELPGKPTEKKGAIAHQPLMVAAAKVEKSKKWTKLISRADQNDHEQSKSRALEAPHADTVGNDKQRIPHDRPREHATYSSSLPAAGIHPPPNPSQIADRRD
ncbi:hypothetical protein GW17_00040261 [Ensete ventricosum]|nr:hypothetical protein GW17_00040261 [Ensete ventricosum]RZR85793.1 hypothetical protein BHM03_00012832 [Ensete ventricosum]